MAPMIARRGFETMAGIASDRSVEWAIRALDWCVRRHRIISSNIVNRDTPGYRAVDMDFRKVMEQIHTEGEQVLHQTNRVHFPSLSGGPLQALTVKDAAEGLDGNSVNLSEEMAHLVENNYTYQALIKHVHRKLQAFKIAIQGG
jgi:flagellar basal-body rod protein FlgB